MQKTEIKLDQPFSLVSVNRFLVIVIIVLAIFSGYFHARYTNEEKKYQRLLIKYQNLQEQNSLSVEEKSR